MNARNILSIAFCAVFFLISVPNLPAESEGEGPVDSAQDTTLTVDEIVNRTNRAAYYAGSDGRADVTMVITDSQDRTRQRQFTILRRNDDAESDGSARMGNQKFYVYFHRPADVNQMAYLVWKRIGADDDRWLYLPALDLVRRIAASDERTSFVGSNFFYEDVSGREIDADIHELEQTTDNYYVLKSTPKDPRGVEFAYFRMWIHRGTFLPVKTEYYDAQDQKYRVYEVLKVDQVDGFHTVMESRMSDLPTRSNTVLTYNRVQYNIGLPEAIFSERFLRNPPREYIRRSASGE